MCVWEEAEKEAASNPRLEGGGKERIAPRVKGYTQGNATWVHVDWTGCLLSKTLHPTYTVHLNLKEH